MARILNKTKRSVVVALSMAFIGATPSVIQANLLSSINSYKVLGAIAATAATVSGVYAASHWHRTATHTTNDTPKSVRSTQKSVSIEYLNVNNKEDLDAVMAILQESQSDEEQLRLIREKIEKSDTLVVRKDSKIIGTATFALERVFLVTDAWIWFVGIKTGYQSKGYGKMLMQRVMQELQHEKKVNSVGILVDHDNSRAQALYKKNGLEVVGEYQCLQDKCQIRIRNFTHRGYLLNFGYRFAYQFGLKIAALSLAALAIRYVC